MKLVIACAAAILIAPAARATTITFSGYGFGNTAVATYSEGGYTITALTGNLQSTSGNGNPAPSIYASGPTSFSLTGPGLFDFLSFQGANGAFSDTAGYTVTGYVANTQVYAASYSVSGTSFVTLNDPSATTAVDTLRFDVTGLSSNIDNIVVNGLATAVPEPSTLGLLLAGVCGAVSVGVRRRKL